MALAATVGVLSPNGNEIGPFLSIEQAARTQLIPDARRTHTFAWYNLLGSCATALGALGGGWLAQGLQWAGYPPVEAYRAVRMTYAILGGLLCLVPLMPTATLTVIVLLLRFSISQMDVPTRQSYTMAVVAPDERSAASGVTTIARSVGASVSPSLAGVLLASAGFANVPLFLAGGLKLVDDLLLYRSFKHHALPEERGRK